VQGRPSAAVVLVLGVLTADPRVRALAQAKPAAQSQQSTKDAADRAQKRIEALHREAELLAGQERGILKDVRTLEVERDLRLEEARRLDIQILSAAAQVEQTGREIETLNQSIAAARPGLNARLVEVYKLGRPGYARVLLGVGDLREIGRATRMVSALAQMDQRRVNAFRETVSRLADRRRALDQQSAALRALQADARRAADLAVKAAAAREVLVRRIDDQRDLNAQMVGELEAAALKLQRMLQALPGAASPGELVVLPIKPFRGALEWPVAGRVSSRFGRLSREGSAAQNGIEIDAADGQPVRAVHDGRVAFADVFAGLGQLIIVDHGGMAFSLYGHLGSMDLPKGAAVAHGQALGSAGRGPTGNSSVYFELRIDGKPVDPVEWLKGR
jgi:septal ring factor EnvC (AmiA/AmiB activator)